MKRTLKTQHLKKKIQLENEQKNAQTFHQRRYRQQVTKYMKRYSITVVIRKM